MGVMHLFSGRVDQSVLPGDTVDVNAALEPTYVDDAQSLEHVPLTSIAIVAVLPGSRVTDRRNVLGPAGAGARNANARSMLIVPPTGLAKKPCAPRCNCDSVETSPQASRIDG
jgi:hypothetical protein